MSDITEAKTVVAEDAARRKNDPEYALARSKEEFSALVAELYAFVGEFDGEEAAKFVSGVSRKSSALNQKLTQVQGDIDAVSAERNPGWTSPYPRRGVGRIAYGPRWGSRDYDGSEDDAQVNED